MSSLAALGSLTVVSVQSSLKSSTNGRSQTIAMYAAESGGAVAMDYLRSVFDANLAWGSLVHPGNISLSVVPNLVTNPFSSDQNASYSVELLNNRNDPGFDAGTDEDAQIIIRSTGHGPQGSVAILEWEVRRVKNPPPAPALPTDPRWTYGPNDPLILVGWHVVL